MLRDALEKARINKETLYPNAQNMPGIVDMMKAYGKYDELVSRSNEYLKVYTTKIFSSLSNNSS